MTHLNVIGGFNLASQAWLYYSTDVASPENFNLAINGQIRQITKYNYRQISHCTVYTVCLLQGMIETIYLDEGELISAGVDGFVRVSCCNSIAKREREREREHNYS